jgi:hypothetical protein
MLCTIACHVEVWWVQMQNCPQDGEMGMGEYLMYKGVCNKCDCTYICTIYLVWVLSKMTFVPFPLHIRQIGRAHV